VRILLLDLDGVLLQTGGYHAALREVVRLISGALGFGEVRLSQETIDLFEAAGVTSEWDSTAICAALLLDRAWELYPSLTLPREPPLPALPSHSLNPPDFEAFARSMFVAGEHGLSPIHRAERALLGPGHGRTPEQTGALQTILEDARDIRASLTHRLVQELNLGSPTFREIYRMPPVLDVPSYLREYDRPALSPATASRIGGWLKMADHRAVLFSNRPSRSPGGSLSPPEAEIGAEVAGLGSLPMVAMGPLSRESNLRGQGPQAFLKPSPIHALAAMLHATGTPLVEAVACAAGLVLDSRKEGEWDVLNGGTVYVFEDVEPGMLSALGAEAALRGIGVGLGLGLFGIATSAPKRRSLESVGATVYPDIETALASMAGLL
jgi:hypothetical protein